MYFSTYYEIKLKFLTSSSSHFTKTKFSALPAVEFVDRATARILLKLRPNQSRKSRVSLRSQTKNLSRRKAGLFRQKYLCWCLLLSFDCGQIRHLSSTCERRGLVGSGASKCFIVEQNGAKFDLLGGR